MRFRINLRHGAVALVATLPIAACGGGNSSSSTAGSPATSGLTNQLPAPKGDVAHLNWAMPQGEPASIDPTQGSDLSPTFVTSNLCESLLKLNPDFSIANNLASKVATPDPTTYVYTLRDGVRFWDGKPMTADDVVYSLKYAARPESFVAFFFENVKSIRATGPHQVTVKLSKPDALFNRELAGSPGAVMEKAFSEKAGKKLGTAKGGLMCTGPFKLASWKSGQSIELVRNDDYWDPAGRAKAATVSLKFLTDSTALAQALIAGEVDGAYEIPPAIIPSLQKASSGRLHQGPSTEYLEMGALRPGGPLANPDLRAALFWSIDRKALASAVFHNTATPNYTLVSTNSFDPGAKRVYQQAYAKYAKAHTLTIDQAKQLVQKAGARGKTIKLAALAGDATQSQLAQLVQEQGQQLGLKIKIEPVQPTQYAQLFVDPKLRGNYDLYFVTGFNGLPEPVELLGFVITSKAFYNFTGYSNKQVDQLIDQARQTADAQERAKLVTRAQDIFEREPHDTSLLSRNEVMFLNKKYTGAITSFTYLGRPSLAAIGAAG
jgi:peptide/nickel transport system substrate-binding protein